MKQTFHIHSYQQRTFGDTALHGLCCWVFEEKEEDVFDKEGEDLCDEEEGEDGVVEDQTNIHASQKPSKKISHTIRTRR